MNVSGPSGSNYNPFRTENDKPTSDAPITGMGKLSGDYGKTSNWFFRKVYDSVAALFSGKYWKGGWFAPKQSGSDSDSKDLSGRYTAVLPKEWHSDAEAAVGMTAENKILPKEWQDDARAALDMTTPSGLARDDIEVRDFQSPSVTEKMQGMVLDMKLADRLKSLGKEKQKVVLAQMKNYLELKKKDISSKDVVDSRMARAAFQLLKNQGIGYNTQNNIFVLTGDSLGQNVGQRVAAIDEATVRQEGFQPLRRGETLK